MFMSLLPSHVNNGQQTGALPTELTCVSIFHLFIVFSIYFAKTAYRCGLTESVPVPCAEPRLWLIPSGEMATLQPTLYYFKFSLSCRLKVKNSNYKVQVLGQERIGLAR